MGAFNIQKIPFGKTLRGKPAAVLKRNPIEWFQF